MRMGGAAIVGAVWTTCAVSVAALARNWGLPAWKAANKNFRDGTRELGGRLANIWSRDKDAGQALAALFDRAWPGHQRSIARVAGQSAMGSEVCFSWLAI